MIDQTEALAAHLAHRVPTSRVHRLVDDEPDCEQLDVTELATVAHPSARRAPVARAAHLPPTITDRTIQLLAASPEPLTVMQLLERLPADAFEPASSPPAKRLLALLRAAERDGRVVRAGVLPGRAGAVLWTVPSRLKRTTR